MAKQDPPTSRIEHVTSRVRVVQSQDIVCISPSLPQFSRAFTHYWYWPCSFSVLEWISMSASNVFCRTCWPSRRSISFVPKIVEKTFMLSSSQSMWLRWCDLPNCLRVVAVTILPWCVSRFAHLYHSHSKGAHRNISEATWNILWDESHLTSRLLILLFVESTLWFFLTCLYHFHVKPNSFQIRLDVSNSIGHSSEQAYLFRNQTVFHSKLRLSQRTSETLRVAVVKGSSVRVIVPE